MPRVSCAGRRRVRTREAGSPAPWAVWLAARSAPASAARLARSTACSEFPIAAIAAAAITTATVVSAVIGKITQPSFRDGPKDQTSDVQLHIGESRDSRFARSGRAPEGRLTPSILQPTAGL